MASCIQNRSVGGCSRRQTRLELNYLGAMCYVQWVKDLTSQLNPLSQGHYLNFVDFEDPMDTERSFPPANWVRVQAAKAAYDPHTLFRSLQYQSTLTS